MWELAILASQRACMRVVVHRLAAVLLEFPAALQAVNRLQAIAAPGYKQHAGAVCLTPSAPAPVPDADSSPVQSELNKQKRHREGVVFVCWDGGTRTAAQILACVVSSAANAPTDAPLQLV